MRAEIARLHHRLGATMIYVTHDQVEALTLGQRVAVMKEGIIQQVADPMELYQHPANRFVAGFIGSPPMNFFHGMVLGETGCPCLPGTTCTARRVRILITFQPGNAAHPGLAQLRRQAGRLRHPPGAH